MPDPNKPPLTVSLLDYGAGNVRSVRNAILKAGYAIEDITSIEQIETAKVIIFPGVGSYKSAMNVLHQRGFVEPLKAYLSDATRPYLGICLGMQTLFASSEETSEGEPPIAGLGIIPSPVVKFDESIMAVPHIGWNGRIQYQDSPVFRYVDPEDDVYFVHSYYAPRIPQLNQDWILTTTHYQGQEFISSVQKGAIVACQFHPEKSGQTGLNFIRSFLDAVVDGTLIQTQSITVDPSMHTQLVKRIVVALDVRQNDHGDLVVTKGDQYDVRENTHDNSTSHGRGGVRNLGKPVALASRYYQEGADEIAFLNITSFRQGVIEDMPMLQVLEEASRNIFVPLTVGGGIRSYTDPFSGVTWDALEVASRYFRAGADKISIGSDAVLAAEDFINSGYIKSGTSSIEMISHCYGAQAVVISLDPKRVYLENLEDADPNHVAVELDEDQLGPNGQRFCWYQCTVKGGRENRDVCAVTVAKAVEALGAGEIMLNCIDMDGQCRGYDHALMQAVKSTVSIPVIASSGAGNESHFLNVFSRTGVQAALAAGIFHRNEVAIEDVKKYLMAHGVPCRSWYHG